MRRILFILLLALPLTARSYDKLPTLEKVFVGKYADTGLEREMLENRGLLSKDQKMKALLNDGRANQGIASFESRFFTSRGFLGQEEAIFRYDPAWGEANVKTSHPISYSPSLYHVGDICANDIHVYAPLSNFGAFWEKPLFHLAWFDAASLAKIGHLDVTSWNVGDGDVAGVAVTNNRLFVIEYQETGTARIFNLPMVNNTPQLENVLEYEISTLYSNGIDFISDYTFITWDSNPFDTVGYIDVYQTFDLDPTLKATPMKTFEFEADQVHAEGLVFHGSELWMAQNTYVYRIDNPVPPAPEGVNADDGLSTDRIRIQWDPVVGASGYDVYRGSSSNPAGAAWIFHTASPPAVDDSNLTPGEIYHYWVRAKRETGGTSFTSPFGKSDTGFVSLPGNRDGNRWTLY